MTRVIQTQIKSAKETPVIIPTIIGTSLECDSSVVDVLYFIVVVEKIIPLKDTS